MTVDTLFGMTGNIPDDARERALAVLQPLLDALHEIPLPEGPNTAVIFRLDDEGESAE